MATFDDHLAHLPPVAARLGFAAARPRAVAVASVLALTALGWLWLAIVAVQNGSVWSTLCGAQGVPAPSTVEAGLLISMWSAMVLAMMVPSAAPMILTYAEIADTAARKKQSVVSPVVLATGYATVWLGFGLVASVLQIALARSGLLSAETGKGTGIAAGLLLTAAGVYQFTALKDACLRLCRQPFQFFLMHWRTTLRGVLKLGLRHGIYCLGCCWALMLLMLLSGAMNVIWMAVLAALMTIEKLGGAGVKRALGVTLMVIGAGCMLAQWWIV